MSEKTEKRSFWNRLFFEDPVPEEDTQGVNPSNFTTGATRPFNVAQAPAIELTGDAATFVKRFREGIQKTNEVGQSFIQILYNLNPEPNESNYQQAFQLIKIMNPSLTADDIKSSLERLIAFVRSETANYNEQGNRKMTQLRSALQGEKESLENTIAGMQKEISAIRQDLQAKELELSRQQTTLNAVDGKYQPEINNTQNVLTAVKTASEETCSSLEQFLTGVKNHLKNN